MRVVFFIIGMIGLGILHAETPTDSKQQNALGPAFRTACWSGDLNKVTLLLSQGAPLEGRDDLGRTPLILASRGYPEIVKMLLARGAKIDAAENDGDLAIAHACESGDLTSAQMLLAAGSDIHHINKNGHSALMLAAREGHDALVSLLISHRVDVNQNGPEGSAIWWAVGGDKQSIVQLLIDAGADPNLKSTRPADPQNPRVTLLASATVTNDLAMIDLLLAHGANINGRGEDGTRPLMVAVWSAKEETVLYLLEKGADPNAVDDLGQTALMLAAEFAKPPALQSLLERGAKMELKDKKGLTALMWACHEGVLPNARLLIDQGADINAVDAQGETALTYAGDCGDSELVQVLRDKGAKRTDLHIIARERPSQALPPAHAWTLAVGAIYAQHNGENPQVLGYGDKDAVEQIRSKLKEEWEVTNKASFLARVEDIRASRHRDEFQIAGAKLCAMDDAAFDAFIQTIPVESAAAKATRASYLKWRKRSGLAWDLCRCANLINWGYASGYVDEKEAWDLLMPIAQQTQGSFNSWQEMSDNFLDGREIDANKRDPRFEACSRLLLNPQDPNSPWNQNSWQTDLSAR